MEDDDENPPIAIRIDDLPEQIQSESFSRSETSRGNKEEPAVGVTVITGYLGAGKSTLINNIINGQHGKRIAVILNEFGEEIGLERAMINDGDGGALVEEWVELANGCVCCTVKHSLVQALEQLVQRKDRIDHILLETTGLADPAPLASVLWLDDQLESAVRLDSIITVVDAKNIGLQLKEYRDSASFPEAFLQIAFADVVILNKVDLILLENRCSDLIRECLEDLQKEIHSINSLATVLQAVHCQVDLHEILDRKAYGANHLAHLEALLEDSKTAPVSSRHDYSVRTFCICEELPVDLNKVRLWLEDLLWEKKSNMDVYRCKGVLNVHGSDQLHTLQAVRELYEVVPARPWRQTEQKISKIVFIGMFSRSNSSYYIDSFLDWKISAGRDLDDETVLRKSFRSCLI